MTQQIRLLLLEAPSTSTEIADIVGITPRKAVAFISLQKKWGYVEKTGQRIPRCAGIPGPPLELYTLTDHGRAKTTCYKKSL